MEDLFDIGINIISAKERFSGHEEIYKKFLYKFPFNINIQKGFEYVKAGDMANAYVEFHKLSSLSGDLSLYKVHEITLEILDELRMKKSPSDKKYGRLQNEFNKVSDAIRKLEKDNVALF